MRLTSLPCFLLILAPACGDDEKDDKASEGGSGMVESGVDVPSRSTC
jgi:hypothetical protein